MRRLLRLPFAPVEPEDVAGLSREFDRVLRRCASDEHLAAVVDRLVETSSRCPCPADVCAAVEAVEPPELATISYCGQCVEGWKQIERNGVECVEMCACRAERKQ